MSPHAESLRGALRIGEAITRRRHMRAALDGNAWGRTALGPMVLDDEERMLGRAIAAIVALDDVPLETARSAARIALLTSGWIESESPECYVARMRMVIRVGRRTLSVVPAPPIGLAERRRAALLTICIHKPLGEIEPANETEGEESNG